MLGFFVREVGLIVPVISRSLALLVVIREFLVVAKACQRSWHLRNAAGR